MSDDLTALTARQHLERIEDALRELLRRNIVRSRNAPLGDVAERIVWLARGGTLEPNSAKSHDVTTIAGDRIQVKARIMKGSGGKFSQFRSFEFTSAIFLSFDPSTLDIAYARELSSAEVTVNGSRSGWTNATTLTGGRVKGLGTDVTDEMRASYARLDEITEPA